MLLLRRTALFVAFLIVTVEASTVTVELLKPLSPPSNTKFEFSLISVTELVIPRHTFVALMVVPSIVVSPP